MIRGRREMGAAAGTPPTRVLIVDDDADTAEMIRDHLTRERYDVRHCRSGAEALRQVEQTRPDVILLEIMVPDVNGLEVCRRLKQHPDTSASAVIMVTARTDEGDRTLAFAMGADDYVPKPFAPSELLARIRAVLRRRQPADGRAVPHYLKAGDLEIDRARFEVRMQGRPVPLTRTEFELLATLVGRPGRVFQRDELLDLIWRPDAVVGPRTVDVHVARLRGRFTSARVPLPRIEAVRGVGYRFQGDSTPATTV